MFALAGGHWAVMQSVAWGQMLWEYSQQEGSLLAGAEKTFSGKAPCSMCKHIAEAKQQEEKTPATLKMDKKVDTTLVDNGVEVALPSSRDHFFPLVMGGYFTRSEAPPTPVPITRA